MYRGAQYCWAGHYNPADCGLKATGAISPLGLLQNFEKLERLLAACPTCSATTTFLKTFTVKWGSRHPVEDIKAAQIMLKHMRALKRHYAFYMAAVRKLGVEDAALLRRLLDTAEQCAWGPWTADLFSAPAPAQGLLAIKDQGPPADSGSAASLGVTPPPPLDWITGNPPEAACRPGSSTDVSMPPPVDLITGHPPEAACRPGSDVALDALMKGFATVASKQCGPKGSAAGEFGKSERVRERERER